MTVDAASGFALPADHFLPNLAIALAVGLLIGIERGWSLRKEPPGGRVAGVRTFAILGLLGGLTGLEEAGPYRFIFLLAAAGAAGALLIGYTADMRRDRNVSATSIVAGMLAIGLGAAAGAGHLALASVGGGAAMVLLASRRSLHRALDYMSEADLRALIRLVLVAFVVLPLLPDRALDPLGAINPQRLWTVVVVIGVISFGGYVLTRWLGDRRGILLTAFFGALVSSTAVTIESARRLRAQQSEQGEHAAIAIASSVMLSRTLILVAALAPAVLASVAPLIVPALAVSAVFTLALIWMGRKAAMAGDDDIPVKPPGLRLAFLFAALVAILSLLSAWAQSRIGDWGSAAVVAVGGAVDVDAAIATIGTMPAGRIDPGFAAIAIALPVLFNTLLKMAMLLGIAGPRLARSGAAALGLTAAAIIIPLAAALL